MTTTTETYGWPGIYRSIVRECMRGTKEKNARTGVEISMIEGGISFKIDLSNGKLPVPDNRRYYPHVAAAETAWQFMGTQDPEFILAWAPKLWSKFLNQEGLLETAYGYRWMTHFGRDQLRQAMHELATNPTNRQLFISAWDPSADGLGGEQPKNIPCPVGFTLSRSEDRLHMSVFIRSSDVFVGLPYDVMSYALTMDAIAAQLNIKLGTMHVTLAHSHIYKPHWENTHTDGPKICFHEPNLPGWSFDLINEMPHTYVKTVKTLANRVRKHDWDPMPEVIE